MTTNTTKKKRASTKKRRSNGEGTVRKVGPNAYQGRIKLHDPDTGEKVTKWARGRSRIEVVELLRDVKLRFEKGQSLHSNKRTVEQYLREWLGTYVRPTKRYSTLRSYTQHCEKIIIPALGRIPLNKLNGVRVQQFLNWLHDSGLSPTTCRNVNATLKTALTRAVKEPQYGLAYNVAKLATPAPQVKFNPKPLTADQGIRLLNVVVQHRFEGLIYLGMLQGMRRAEVAGLQWSNIDYDLGMIRVRSGLQRVKGAGSVLLGVKTKDSERDIPLLPVVAAALRRRRERQEQERREAGKNWKQDGDFVFTSRYGARIQPEEPLAVLKEALKLAALPDIRYHDLRHSCAVMLKALGVDLKLIQMILGHSSYQITANLYLKSGLSDEVVAATQVLNDRFERSLLASGSPAAKVDKKADTAKAEIIQ